MLDELSKPIAFWSPLPPAKSGIADYSFELLGYLGKKHAITAVVDDRFYNDCKPPAGIAITKASSYTRSEFSTNVFQFGNHFGFHGYMYQPLLQYGGVTVLHDLSLFDFHISLCTSTDSSIFLEELIFDNPDLKAEPGINKKFQKSKTVNRLDFPLLRRIVNASNLILTHSTYAKHIIEDRYRANVRHINQGIAPFDATSAIAQNNGGKVIFGVLGGIARHKNVIETLEAFIKARSKNPKIKLLIAGRADDQSILKELENLIYSLDKAIQEDIELHTDISFDELKNCITQCDVQILLRWPTAGETSRTLLHGFTLGKPALISPLPQWLEYPNEFCWPIADRQQCTVDDLADKILTVAADKKALIKAGILAKQWAEDNLDWDDISSQLLSYIRYANITGPINSQQNILQSSGNASKGFNVIAPLSASTGLAEAARRSIKAIYDSGNPISIADCNIGAHEDEANVPQELINLRKGLIFPKVNICYLNINEVHCLDHALLYRNRGTQKLIASWWWEATQIPDRLVQSAQEVRPDAIVVGSNFVKDIFKTFFPFPTYVVPPVVEVDYDPNITKKRFNIPENKLVYLVSFDANSSLQRKNPLGVIDAYKKASPDSIVDSVLVIKASHLAKYPEARKIVKEKLEDVNGILIEEHISGKEMGSLLSLADVYISLHRAEGLGLGMAEAMYLGKPVIGTAYSGNTDFLNNNTGCPVGYELVEIKRGDLYLNRYLDYADLQAPKGKHSYWAEPDLDDATGWIQELARSDSLREKLGHSGQKFILDNYNSKIHAQRMHAIIDTIS